MNLDAALVHEYLLENGPSSPLKIGEGLNLLPHRVAGALSLLEAVGWASGGSVRTGEASGTWIAKPKSRP